MYNIKKFQFCLIILLTLMFVGVCGVFGQEQSSSEFYLRGEYRLTNAETPIYGADQPALF